MLGSHHQLFMFDGTEDGIRKPSAGKQDDARLSSGPARLPDSTCVAESPMSGSALPTVKIKERIQVRERRVEVILAGFCYSPAGRLPLRRCFIAHGLDVSGDNVQAGEGDTEERTPHVRLGQ